MNLLIDVAPKTVSIDNKEYKINTDFRISMMFENLMQDRNYKENEKIALAMHLYYPIAPENIEGAVERLLWFYRCGKELDEEVAGNKDTEKVEDVYSFEHDDEYIYSAFLDQYNIDLQDDNLHWWKFRALFKGLKEDNLINKIMGYRATKITDDMTDKEKAYYRKMKEIYKIPDNRTKEEKEIDFNNSMSSMF